jgi:rubrerythrin
MSKYIVCRHPRHYDRKTQFHIEIIDYPTKKEALTAASNLWQISIPAYVLNSKTEQITYILPRDKSSCRVCGNQLDGKLHCPLCKALHHYT